MGPGVGNLADDIGSEAPGCFYGYKECIFYRGDEVELGHYDWKRLTGMTRQKIARQGKGG